MFNWGISRDLLEVNPCAQVKSPGKEKQRQRVLTDDEIRKVWLAFEQLEPMMSGLYKLRLLTAQRGFEVASMRWEDIELTSGWWTIPPHIAKNKLAHRVPLSAPARDVPLRLRPAIGAGQWVFPSPTRTGQCISNIQKPILQVRENSQLVDFVAHDLRRTAASKMTGMGIPRLVVGMILNHVESGVTRVYDRHGYDQEKRQAMEAWAQRLDEILANTGDNVIRLGRQS